MRKLIMSTVAGIFALSAPAFTYAADVTVGADALSAYVWRGITFNDEGVIQPSVDVALPANFGLNVWGNWDIGDYNDAVESADFSEIDITLSYAVPVEGLDLSVGIISYLFPQAGADANTTEVFASAGVGLVENLSTSVDVYYDFDQVEDYYASWGLAYGITVDENLSLELGGSIGYAGEDASAGTEDGFHDWNVSLSAAYAVAENTELGAIVAYTDSLDDDVLPDQDVDVYGGVSLYHSF